MSKVILNQLEKLLTTKPFKVIDNNAMLWRNIFGVRDVCTPTVIAIPAFPIGNRKDQLELLAKMIQQLVDNRRIKQVKDDIIDRVIKEKNTSLIFSHLKNLDLLYGIKIWSAVDCISITYSAIVTSDLHLLENVLISDGDILDKVQEIGQGLVVGNYIIPSGGSSFDSRFFYQIKDIMEGRYDEVEGVHDEVNT